MVGLKDDDSESFELKLICKLLQERTNDQIYERIERILSKKDLGAFFK